MNFQEHIKGALPMPHKDIIMQAATDNALNINQEKAGPRLMNHYDHKPKWEQ